MTTVERRVGNQEKSRAGGAGVGGSAQEEDLWGNPTQPATEGAPARCAVLATRPLRPGGLVQVAPLLPAWLLVCRP